MFKHYLTTALRHFARHKLATVINIACLALGITCFLCVYLIVEYYNHSDLSFPNARRIYALTERMDVNNGSFVVPMEPYTNGAVGKHLKADLPAVTIARALQGEDTSVSYGTEKTTLYTSFVDPEFLDIFPFRSSQGISTPSLRQARSAVITQDAARRLFGSERNAIGRELILTSDQSVTITGVLGPIQQPSHMGTNIIAPLRFDLLVSFDVLEKQAERDGYLKSRLDEWTNLRFFTYVRLPSDGSISHERLNRRVAALTLRAPPGNAKYQFGAIPISELRLERANVVMGTDKTGLS